jgi:chemotaxis methyl-accepting protein methylase
MARETLERLAKLRVFGKSPIGAYLRLNELIWNRVPRSMRGLRPITSYGHLLHSLVLLRGERQMYLGTLFLRNRPELELIRRLSKVKARNRRLKIAVLGSSNGAEVYSIMWAIRSMNPNLNVAIEAVDISPEALKVAERGIYSLGVSELVREPVLHLMSSAERQEMFEREGDEFRVKPTIKDGIRWHLGDAGSSEIRDTLGPQDIVVANRFLCHMAPADAERCLRNIARLVAPDGYLFVSGVDLDVRTKVAKELGWRPLSELLKDVHEGDATLTVSWPFKYWGLEPFDKSRPDWRIRYASVFQLRQQNLGGATTA